MVIAAAGDEAGENKKKMTTVPERSRSSLSLHNFSSLPCFNVKWGRQKQLRCVKDSSSGADHDFPTSLSSSPNQHSRQSSPDIGGIQAMREKLMLEIRSEAQALQMKASLLTDRRTSGDGDGDDIVAVGSGAASKPWNLRSRRAVCKEPTTSINNNNNSNVAGSSDWKPNFEVKSPKRSAELTGGGCVVPREKFSVSLSKQEIEEDFLAISGTRPARRPKKRPRYVQKQIDGLFPGYWLSEITADMYKVNENPEAGKR